MWALHAATLSWPPLLQHALLSNTYTCTHARKQDDTGACPEALRDFNRVTSIDNSNDPSSPKDIAKNAHPSNAQTARKDGDVEINPENASSTSEMADEVDLFVRAASKTGSGDKTEETEDKLSRLLSGGVGGGPGVGLFGSFFVRCPTWN